MPVEIRGASVASFLEAVQKIRGPASEAALRAALPAALRERWERGAIARVGWYPLSDYAELHSASDRLFGGGTAFARLIGRTTAEIDTRGLIRYVLSITSPELLVRHAPLVFSSYVRGGEVHTDSLGPKHYRIRFRMEGASPLIFADFEGGAAYLIERTGGHDVVTTSDPTVDPGVHAFEVRWR